MVILCTLPCDVATGVCCTLLFLLRVCDEVKVTSLSPLLLSHHDQHDLVIYYNFVYFQRCTYMYCLYISILTLHDIRTYYYYYINACALCKI